MTIGIPRNEAEEPSWREAMTEAINVLPDHVNGRVTTTDDTSTHALSLPILPGIIYFMNWVVSARQTAGSAGTVGNGLVYHVESAWSLVSGSATQIGSASNVLAVKDDSAWSVSLLPTANKVYWTVTGDTNQTIGWRVDVNIRRIVG